ncbi:MAG: hypothetical protein ACR2LL_04485 [Nitrosopumilus sp.]
MSLTSNLQCRRCSDIAVCKITLTTKNESGVYCNDCKLEIEDLASLAPRPILLVEKLN